MTCGIEGGRMPAACWAACTACTRSVADLGFKSRAIAAAAAAADELPPEVLEELAMVLMEETTEANEGPPEFSGLFTAGDTD